MSQTFFSKQDLTETVSRLSMLGLSGGKVTIWLKGKKEKHTSFVSKFDKDRMELVLESLEAKFTPGQTVLCAFEIRGMNFFSEVVYQISISGHMVLQFTNTLFKSERRTSYRLMTYPMYEVWAEFDLGETYEGGRVINLKTGSSQTGLFKSFLKIVQDTNGAPEESKISIRVQDLSTTGMALHIGDLEAEYFKKDTVFTDVKIRFTDLSIIIPAVKIVYVVDYVASDKNLRKFKLGIHFENLPAVLDDQLGKKINQLLRSSDSNKDFENFIK